MFRRMKTQWVGHERALIGYFLSTVCDRRNYVNWSTFASGITIEVRIIANHRQSAAEASRPPAHRQSLPQVRLRVTGSRYQSCAAGSIQIWAEEILAGFSAWPTGLYLSPQAQQDCAVA